AFAPQRFRQLFGVLRTRHLHAVVSLGELTFLAPQWRGEQNTWQGRRTMRNRLLAAFLALLGAAWSQHANAQTGSYPARPIAVIVPFAAGGPTDVVARI